MENTIAARFGVGIPQTNAYARIKLELVNIFSHSSHDTVVRPDGSQSLVYNEPDGTTLIENWEKVTPFALVVSELTSTTVVVPVGRMIVYDADGNVVFQTQSASYYGMSRFDALAAAERTDEARVRQHIDVDNRLSSIGGNDSSGDDQGSKDTANGGISTLYTSDTGQKSGGFTVKTSAVSPSTIEAVYGRGREALEGPEATLDTRNEPDTPAPKPTDHYEKIVDLGLKSGWPVLLDLTGDGIRVTVLSTSQHSFDANNDGLKNRIAWAAAGNGVLFYDPDNTGEITETRQVFFTEWDPTATSDLEALASVFETNGDGGLEANDRAFADFKVMVTNADGSLEAKTLNELGITSIGFTGDATRLELLDGSVFTGQTEYTHSDGSTGNVGDVTLAYNVDNHRVARATNVASIEGAQQ